MKNNYIMFLVIVLIIGSFFIGRYTKSSTVPLSTQTNNNLNFDDDTPFLALAYETCPNANTYDDYTCVHEHVISTLNEADKLASSLIKQVPERLKEIRTRKDIMPWEYGGEDFLIDLIGNIEEAQKARDEYLNAVCYLDAMYIYSGTGFDLEKESCRYYYAQQYLSILKRFDGAISPEEIELEY